MSDLDLAQIKDILGRNPGLSWRGWWRPEHNLNYPPDTLDRIRRETTDADGLAQIRRAMAFIAVAPRTKTVNRRHGCYGWKHAAERWTRAQNGGRYEDYYVGEGSFIIASYLSGVTVVRTAYETRVNISEFAYDQGRVFVGGRA
jgi:hypothetical protein